MYRGCVGGMGGHYRYLLHSTTSQAMQPEAVESTACNIWCLSAPDWKVTHNNAEIICESQPLTAFAGWSSVQAGVSFCISHAGVSPGPARLSNRCLITCHPTTWHMADCQRSHISSPGENPTEGRHKIPYSLGVQTRWVQYIPMVSSATAGL